MNKRQRLVVSKPNFKEVSSTNRHWRGNLNQIAVLFVAIAIAWSIVTINPFYNNPVGIKEKSDISPTSIKYTLPIRNDSPSINKRFKDEITHNEERPKAFSLSYKDADYYVYRVSVNDADIKLYWKDSKGDKFKNFLHLKQNLEREKKKLIFAMNGGIYSKNNDPVGLYIEDGIAHFPLLTDTAGFGNFFMQPNGVFAFSENRALILPTHSFIEREHEKFQYAIQSGPMLLIDNNINKKFDPNSSNKFIRNGVGIDSNGQLYFVISNDPVNFYEIAGLFKKKLNCQNALYLDGSISNMYLPEIGLNDLNGDFGSIIGVTMPDKL